MEIEKNKKSSLLIFFLTTLLVFILLLLLTYFQNTKNILEQETNRSLKENANQISMAVDYRIDIQMERLHTIAFTYQQYLKMNDDSAADAYLQSRASKYMFKYLAVLTPENKELWNEYSRTEPFKQSLKGNTDIAYIESSPIDGKGAVLYTVPYVSDGKVKAILVGERTKEKVAEVLDIERFANHGKYVIVDKGGAIVAHNKYFEHLADYDFYSLLNDDSVENREEVIGKLQDDLKHHKTGELTYVQDGEKILMNYNVLNSVDWTVISMVQKDVLSKESSLFMQQAIKIIIIVESILAVLFYIFIRKNRKYSKALETVAYVDPITQGNTSIRFEELYNERMKNLDKQYALVTIDIDKFKIINDTFGKVEGDKTLNYIYHILSKKLGKDEVIARGQSDVFYLLKEFTSKEDLMDEFDMIVQDVDKCCHQRETREYTYKLTLSAGVYIIENHKIPLVIAVARSTVARKKKTEIYGGQINTCFFYSEDDREKLLKETEIINRMESALQNHEFIVYLQPKIDCKKHCLRGAEALVRWNDSKKGMVFPNEFIPIFEKTGFIKKVDLYVFEKCCQLVKGWMEEGKDIPVISINLSRVHFTNPNFLDDFVKIREKYDVPAHFFEMEITETVVCGDPLSFKEHIRKIHEAGFTCSLDDFGAGYSSLNVLKNIQVDAIKLDRAFFREGVDEKAKIVIESIVDLAKRLEMKTVAEGVETIELVTYLKGIACDLIQGYYFSRPISIDEFEKKYIK